MAGKEKASQKAKLTGNLICQIKCNLSFSLAHRRRLSLTSLPCFLPSLSLFAKSFIIVIYLQLKMPNIYLILSILQFICLPNRSSNKNLPSPPSSTLFPLPGWVTFGRAYRLRLVGKIFNFLPELSDWKRERGGREREKKGNQNQTNLPGEFKTKVWGWNCWRGFSSRLRSAQKYGSVLSMAVTMATSNAPAYWLPDCLPANEARLASLPLLLPPPSYSSCCHHDAVSIWKPFCLLYGFAELKVASPLRLPRFAIVENFEAWMESPVSLHQPPLPLAFCCTWAE